MNYDDFSNGHGDLCINLYRMWGSKDDNSEEAKNRVPIL